MRTTILIARWIAPMDQAIIRDGAVAFSQGMISAVGPARDVTAAHHDAEVIDLGKSLLLPGLVNAHTHLELSNCSSGTFAGGSFADWILSLRSRSGRDSLSAEELYPDVVRQGIEQCLKFGVTTVGDISQQMHLSRPVLRESGLRCVSYGEVLGTMGLKWRYDELLPRAIDQSCESERLRVGLTPHAPYTVDLPSYRECLSLARRHNLPLATHLTENSEERAFLKDHAGVFRELWEKVGLWQDGLETYRGSPIGFAHAIGLLDYPTLLAHVNYCDDAELDLLARGNSCVVYCPRTHAYFGHPPHRWREMLSRGINVAVGTDSCASSPDLNIVDDLRLLRRIAPEMPAQMIWETATIRAARAIQMEQQVGSITPGKAADFVAFTVTSDEPLEEVLSEPGLPSGSWIAGLAPSP